MNRIKQIFFSSFRRLAAAARLFAFFLVCLAVSGYLTLRAARAQADDSLLALGSHLVKLAESGLGQYERGTYINGQQLGFRVLTVPNSIDEVLTFYENWCAGGDESFAALGDAAAFDVDQSSLRTKSDRSWSDLTARGYEDNMGYVACLKHGMAEATTEDFAERLREFLRTGNLRDVGQFHYAAATRVGDTTRVVAVWTEGDFYPGMLFPETGDAPGFDAEGISRPPSGRRMLSAGEVGYPSTITGYVECEHSASELREFYREDVLRRGWRVMADEAESERLHYFVLQRGGEMRLLVISQEEGDAPSVTIATTE